MLVYESYVTDPAWPTIVCLHGFLGSKEEFFQRVGGFFFGFNTVFVDLPGHGDSVFDDSVGSIERCCEAIQDILDELALESVWIYGYSMGGRIGWSFASLFPESCNTVILESSHPGFFFDSDRDASWRDFLPRWERFFELDFLTFLKHWYDQPLFVETKKCLSKSFLEEKSTGNFEVYLEVMKAYHVSSQMDCMSLLRDGAGLSYPIHYIAGELDEKYVMIGRGLERYGVNLHLVEQADHNVHVSNRKGFERVVRGIL